MGSLAQLCYSPLVRYYHNLTQGPPQFLDQTIKFPLYTNTSSPSSTQRLSFFPFQANFSNPNVPATIRISRSTDAVSGDGADGNDGHGGGGGGSRSGGSGSGGSDDSSSSSSPWDGLGPIGAFLSGWRSRVAADPQFPFKVLMEEVVGVSSCVLGDMASRPNFGLNELDFVFSTLVVGSIVNFVLMYLLAPTMSSVQTLPSIFASCPTSHMFEPGAYGLLNRLGTFVYKGSLFAAVGFSAGLVGTAISNGLIKARKKMDPNFENPNKPPPTLLNAATWAIHMAVSSNFRYQTLNGVEFLLEKGLPPLAFKSSVVVLRCLNNVLGGVSFVMLARLTGSQSVDESKVAAAIDAGSGSAADIKLLTEGEDLPGSDSISK